MTYKRPPMENGFRNGKNIPTVEKSMAIIAEEAPKALAVLKSMSAMDLIDILGLSEFDNAKIPGE